MKNKYQLLKNCPVCGEPIEVRTNLGVMRYCYCDKCQGRTMYRVIDGKIDALAYESTANDPKPLREKEIRPRNTVVNNMYRR